MQSNPTHTPPARCGRAVQCYLLSAGRGFSNMPIMGPTGSRLGPRLSAGTYRLGTLPPSKNSALSHFVLSRNRRANAVNETGLSEIANTNVCASRMPMPCVVERDIGVHKARVQPTIDHQHRSRLRGHIWMQLLPEVGACFEHPGPFARDVENAVRLHVEVAPARSGVGTNKFTAIFYVKTNGLVVGVEHPSIGGEDELP